MYKGRIQGPAGFERIFVVKRILPHLSEEPAFIRMFVEEAKLSARLNHPNIVQVFELGSVDGEYFISMEYVRGQDLSATMRALWKTSGAPSAEMVAYVGREICRALDYAHSLVDDNGNSLGMIHRDVSPSNVMLSYDGAVKLLDFGIAKALDDAPENTRGGSMKGKYAYMAPEQTDGDDVDHRSDIFAAGIVLYEFLTGRRLFKGANDIQTIERVRRCDVKPPSQLNPACPPALDAVLLKALARDRNHRFQTANDMADALDNIVHRAHFTPHHLATTLRETFGLDAGAPIPDRRSSPSATGSISISTLSAPSPTIPPVVLAPARRSTQIAAISGPGTDAAVVGTLLAKPLYQRASFWLVTLLCLGGVGFGVVKRIALPSNTNSHEIGQPVPAQESATSSAKDRKKPKKVAVLLQSEPEGADIFVYGRLETVGVTPMWFGLEWDADNPARVMFRKSGFQDKAIAVYSERPPVAQLIPLGIVQPEHGGSDSVLDGHSNGGEEAVTRPGAAKGSPRKTGRPSPTPAGAHAR